MTKKLIKDSHQIDIEDFDGKTVEEACEYLKILKFELLKKEAFNIKIVAKTHYYESHDFYLSYERMESDKEYEWRLKREFDDSERERIKKLQVKHGVNFITDLTWDDSMEPFHNAFGKDKDLE